MVGKLYRSHIFVLIVAVTILSSCDKYLDIKPEDTLVETDVFSEEALAERALGEAYLELAYATTGIHYMFADFTTEIVDSDEVEFYVKFIDGGLSPEDATVAGFWLDLYSVINLANSLIVKIPEFGKYNEDMEQQHIAEAKFIRAYAYHKLLVMFGDGALVGKMDGLGLPLQLTPFQGYSFDDPAVARSTVQETYNQIIKDLTESIEFLPESYSSNLDTRSRATVGGAKALLARIYLYMGDFSNAAEYAKQVIDMADVYIFEPNILDLFPDNSARNLTAFSKEYVFGFPFALDEMGNNDISFSYFFKLSLWADEDFIATYEDGDLRKDTLIYAGDTFYNQHLTADRRSTFKFPESYGRDNVPVIRLSEVLLTRAEALASTTGVNQESVDIINQIRNRVFENNSDLTMGDFPDSDVLINKILEERKFELAFEGLHRFDLIRTGRPLRNPNLSEELKVLPIPQIDIDLSGDVILQNPGYNN
ncbi:MAG: RagB/SusD family nutrient uptake outer membrane protein [Cyclobacteriaceae bacterium]